MAENPRSMTDENLPAAAQPESLLAVIERVALNPEADVEKMRALLDMKKEIDAQQAETEYARAMAACQAELQPIATDAANDQTSSKYAKLNRIHERAKPVWTRHGFSLSYDSGPMAEDGTSRIFCTCRHSGGHKELHGIDMALDDKGIKGSVNKTRPHAQGSSISYARRYLALMIFDLTTFDDDDGQSAGAITEEQCAELQGMLDKLGDEAAQLFLAHYHVKDVANLPSIKFGDAQDLLRHKVKSLDAKS